MNKLVCILLMDLTLTCGVALCDNTLSTSIFKPIPYVTRPLRKDIPFLPRQYVFAVNVAKLIMFINSKGYQCTIGNTFRSREEALLMKKEGKGIADSNHCYRMAIDLNLFKDKTYLTQVKDYKFAGEYWESLDKSNEWGGRWTKSAQGKVFSDPGHFEAD